MTLIWQDETIFEKIYATASAASYEALVTKFMGKLALLLCPFTSFISHIIYYWLFSRPSFRILSIIGSFLLSFPCFLSCISKSILVTLFYFFFVYSGYRTLNLTLIAFYLQASIADLKGYSN